MNLSLPKNLSIYLADDDADDRFLFEEALLEVKSDVKVILAVNGEQLMTYLVNN